MNSTRSEALKWFDFLLDPFAAGNDARFFYAARTHAAAVTHCMRTISQQIGIGLVYGPEGTGKSMIMSRLTANLAQRGGDQRYFVHVIDGATVGKAANPMLRDFGVALGERKPIPNYKGYDVIEARALGLLAANTTTVLIFDRSEALSREILLSIVHLWNLVTPDASRFLVRILMFARPTFHRTLSHQKHAALRSRISLMSPMLDPLDRESLIGLIEHRVAVARGPADLFARESLDRVYEISGGNPGRAVSLASQAIVTAYEARQRVVDLEILDRALDRPAPMGSGV